MTVSPLPTTRGFDVPDTASAPVEPPAQAAGGFAGALGAAFADTGAALGRADGAERAFAAGHGGLQEMVLERAQADVALSIASAAASRAAQALTTILGMQI
ncbi:MAG: hypothetical protein NVSMB19_12480 [Vulcanimicrobiaceae bacterium]